MTREQAPRGAVLLKTPEVQGSSLELTYAA